MTQQFYDCPPTSFHIILERVWKKKTYVSVLNIYKWYLKCLKSTLYFKTLIETSLYLNLINIIKKLIEQK